MKVKDHKKYCCFDYVSTTEETKYELGDIVIKEYEDDKPEIGVVIQLHDRGELRTDMFGNCCNSEIRLATLDEIKQYRSDLLIIEEQTFKVGKCLDDLWFQFHIVHMLYDDGYLDKELCVKNIDAFEDFCASEELNREFVTECLINVKEIIIDFINKE